MSAWTVVPCLLALRDEVDRLNPGRDKSADGTIGDATHTSSSDHTPDEDSTVLRGKDPDGANEVHALDIDATGPWPPGQDLDDSVEIIRLRHLRGDDNRLQNIIWRARIASRTWGWAWRPYDGPSRHFDHAHFSARYTTAQEQDTRPWGLQKEDDVTAKDVWTTDGLIANPSWRSDAATNAQITAKTALEVAMYEAHAANVNSAKALAAAAQLAGKDVVDEQAVAAAVLAALDPEKIAAAIPADLARQVADQLAARLAA